ncbi:MAG: ABC transporter permease, partial [Gammaproteobacteria bacterium]|nr:ABC transporter permease [Gammaproteobacteria bacterium]
MSGARYIASRLVQAVVVLLGVSAIVFFCLFLTGDPAALMLSPDANREEIARFRVAMGFDDPVW